LNRADALHEGRSKLCQAGFLEFALEAEILLRHALQVDRTSIYAYLYEDISPDEYCRYNDLLARRLALEPMAYITGHREFYGLDFIVEPCVLIPRPETEMLVEEAIRITGKLDQPVVCDVGTGSGAIAVAIARNVADVKVYGIDISHKCLEVASRNARLNEVQDKIVFVAGDLLTTLPEMADVIVANLPYVKQNDLTCLKGEPSLALDGGMDGLDVIRRMVPQVASSLKQGGTCLLEIGEGQHKAVLDIIGYYLPGARATASEDFAGIKRMITVTLPLVNP